jgi:hypothetical protein
VAWSARVVWYVDSRKQKSIESTIDMQIAPINETSSFGRDDTLGPRPLVSFQENSSNIILGRN